jgi:hypothetical protein
MNVNSVHTAMWRKPGLIAAAAAASALVAIGVPMAVAAPTASPPSDGQGYVDSTARCTKPDTAVIFGTTDSSRVAICKTAGGAYEYRGVRVRDGAKLIVSATPVSSDNFQADSDGATYNVSPTGLSITVGGSTVRTESWNDFHTPQSPAGASGTATTSGKPTTSGAKPSTASSATPTSGSPASGTAASGSATSAAAAPTSAPPLPPPLPAEVGGAPAPKR